VRRRRGQDVWEGPGAGGRRQGEEPEACSLALPWCMMHATAAHILIPGQKMSLLTRLKWYEISGKNIEELLK